MPELRVRAMEAGDATRATEISTTAFEVDRSEPGVGSWFAARVEHLLATDPGGAFVAELDGKLIGLAQAMIRDRLWVLSILAIDPAAQSSGAGRALLERALAYGDSLSAGLIVCSEDSRAIRLYAGAGFSLQPTLIASGTIDRNKLPRADPRVRDGSRADLEALEPIARDVRGATYTPELELVLDHGGRLLRLADRGFAVAHPRHGVWLLVARDEDAAAALLWSAFAATGDGGRPPIKWLTGGQDWAVKVALQAGLRLGPYGPLCTRGLSGPPRPFVPSGPFA